MAAGPTDGNSCGEDAFLATEREVYFGCYNRGSHPDAVIQSY